MFSLVTDGQNGRKPRVNA